MFGRRPPSGIFIRERSFLRLLSLLGFARAESVEIVGPLLHHPSALRQILRIIVCRTDLISFAMCKLTLNPVPIVAQFVEQRRCDGAKAVDTHFVFLIAHTAQGIEHVASDRGRAPCARKETNTCPYRSRATVLAEWPQIVQTAAQYADAAFSCARPECAIPQPQDQTRPTARPVIPWGG